MADNNRIPTEVEGLDDVLDGGFPRKSLILLAGNPGDWQDFFRLSFSIAALLIMVMPSEILGPALTGTGFGIVAICLNTGIAVASPLIGLLLDITGSPALSFLGMALFSASGAIVAYTLKTK